MTEYVFVDHANLSHAIYQSVTAGDIANFGDGDVDDYFMEILTGRYEMKLKSLLRMIGGDPEPVFVLDNFPARKSDTYPRYKMNRTGPVCQPVKRMVDWIKNANLGAVVESLENEADDTIATLCHLNDRSSVVISMDKDLWQLISQQGNISVFCPMRKRPITAEDVWKAFGLTSANGIALHKACWGDAGDNVPNAVPRMQRHLLPLIEASDGTFEHFDKLVLDNYKMLSKRCQELYFFGAPQIEVNYSIVKLDTTCELLWH